MKYIWNAVGKAPDLCGMHWVEMCYLGVLLVQVMFPTAISEEVYDPSIYCKEFSFSQVSPAISSECILLSPELVAS